MVTYLTDRVKERKLSLFPLWTSFFLFIAGLCDQITWKMAALQLLPQQFNFIIRSASIEDVGINVTR